MMTDISRSTTKRNCMRVLWLLLAAIMVAQPDKTEAQWVVNGNNINNTNTGNVGIGTTSPVVKLQVVGEIFSSGTLASNAFQDRTSGRSWVWYGTGDTARFWSPAIGDILGITPTGNIGIGTTNPASKLEVIGNIALSPNNRITSISDWGNYLMPYTSFGRMAFGTAGIDRVSILYNGNVGIGTINPSGLLHLHVGVGDVVQRFSNAGNAGGALDLRYRFESSQHRIGLSDGAGNWLFYTQFAWPNTSAIGFFPGSVGIGTTSPTKKLDVVGDINASGSITGGNIIAKYQDIAEWVPTSQTLTSGTVVVLDVEKNNQVVASRTAYDTRVAGVVSDTPGVILGEAGEGKVKVATTGRVRVKVDATFGPIRVGDLLVTSDKKGIAMKSEPLNLGGTPIHRPGTLIGKALEPLANGVGEILVLLSLQ